MHEARHMRAAFREIEVLFGVLHRLGVKVKVNFEKSSLVISMHGPGKHSLTRDKLVQWRGRLQARFLGPDGSVFIPVVDSIVYLGICLSYGNFEAETARLRIEKANCNFNQLRRALRTNGAFTQEHRLRVYAACVWTSLRYGVCAVGITQHTYSAIVSTVCQHLRKVLRVFQHGVTNQELLEMAAMNPWQDFMDQLDALRARLQAEEGRSQDFVRMELAEVDKRIQELSSVHMQSREAVLIEIASSPGSEFICETCGIGLGTAEGRDMRVKHRRPEVHLGSCIPFCRSEHALHGLPQCRFCRQLLYDFASLRKHIASGTCQTLKQASARRISVAELWLEVLERENVDPPTAPAGLPVVEGDCDASWLIVRYRVRLLMLGFYIELAALVCYVVNAS